MPDNTDPRKPEQQERTAAAKKAAPRKAAAPDLGPEGIRHFSGTVNKRNADGDVVMSDYLEEGDEVVRPDDDEN